MLSPPNLSPDLLTGQSRRSCPHRHLAQSPCLLRQPSQDKQESALIYKESNNDDDSDVRVMCMCVTVQMCTLLP